MAEGPLSRTPLYGGQIKANVIGGFTRLGVNFKLIHPGYDAQGRRRPWTQVVYEGVPVWEWKIQAAAPHVIDMFDRDLKATIGRSTKLLTRALKATVKNRTERFKDGVSGVEPAPTARRRGASAPT